MSFIEVEIRNWAKFNARKDIKKPWWFKLSNSILEDVDIYGLNGEEFKAWIYILSQASKQQSPKVRIVLDHAIRVCGINQKSLNSCIIKLELKQILKQIRTQSVQMPPRSVQQIRLEEIRLEENRRSSEQIKTQSVHFEKWTSECYGMYPKKIGKKKAFERLRTILKTEEDFQKIQQAIANYTMHLKNNKTEPRFIKNFDTFVNQWDDWLDPSTGTAANFKTSAALTEEDFA